MSDKNDDLREQLKVTKKHLEADHGRVLKYGTPKEARAFYTAIKDIDAALEHNWDIERAHSQNDEHTQELLEESRAAREEGYEAAMKLEEERENRREKYEQPSLLERLLPGGD